MYQAFFSGLLSAWMLIASATDFTPATGCNKVNGNATVAASSAQGSGSDQALIAVAVGTSGSPVSNLHEYQVGIQLSDPLSSAATVTADFSVGWVQGSNSYGYATLNTARDKITLHYNLPSCGAQSGYGLVAEILVDNNDTPVNGPELASSSGAELIILVDEE